MARTTVEIPGATPEDVFAVLLDPYCYPHWVVGARRIRDVDPSWPEPGARFHHALGVGAVELKDSTAIVALDPPRSMVLDARFRPLGRAQIRVSVQLEPHGTNVELREEAEAAGAETWHSRWLDVLVDVRNRWALHRLRRLVERRAHQPTPPAFPTSPATPEGRFGAGGGG